MFDVEILKDFDRNCAIFLRTGFLLEYLFEGVYNVSDNIWVFISYPVSILLILFAE